MKFSKILKEKNLDSIFLLKTSYIQESNIDYASGLNLEDSVLVIKKRGKPLLLTSPLSKIRIPSSFKSVNMKDYKKILSGLGKRIGVNASRLPLSVSKKIKGRLVNVDNELSNVRAVKESWEIARIKKAVRITENILSRCFLNFKKFTSETDVAKFLIDEASVYDGTAFDPIVASGNHASSPHSVPQNKPLKRGFCIIDFGVKFKKYPADISRTIYLGAPRISDLKLYEKVLHARDNAFSALKLGIKASAVDAVARKDLDIPHSLGHGVGVEIHEKPFLRPASKDIIRKGMVFTLEPGIYSKTQGIRIEDMVLMKEKAVWLSSAPCVLLRVK